MKILPGLIKTFPDSPEVREAVLIAVLKKAAGEGLIKHAIPLSVEDRKMRIAVRDPIWKKHLEKLAPQLIVRINRFMDAREVTFLAFEIDESLFSAAPESSRESELRHDEPRERLSGKLETRAAAIRDPQLRHLFLECAREYLAAQRSREKKEGI